MKNNSFPISKYTLDNGFTFLLCPVHKIPKVSIQIWYGVGSKNERDGKKGIAHFIEHMIFKGTKKLSEPDIALVAGKLSGGCNAFTSQDYTGYLFDLPSQHWQEALPIFSDCMRNCTFKQELLDSELKAVIQELKMYRDDYEEVLTEKMMSALFAGHPYHHPIIGYKQDLWSLKRDDLLAFYNKYYVPNNATLVVVGDIDLIFAIKAIEKEFGGLKKNDAYIPEVFHLPVDTTSKSVSIYRDVQQSLIQFSFIIPGLSKGNGHLADCVAWILCDGRGSRLHKKLIDELQLAVEVDVLIEDLFDCGSFFIKIRPSDVAFIQEIEHVVRNEIKKLANDGFEAIELLRAKRKILVAYLSSHEDYEELAYEIGKNFLATNRETFFSDYIDALQSSNLEKQVRNFIATFFRDAVMHKGILMPLEEEEKKRWITIQQRSDQEDAAILSTRIRSKPIEKPQYIQQVKVIAPPAFVYPKYNKRVLENGLIVLSCNRPEIEMVDVILDLKAKSFYDPDHLQGLALFMSRMMLEGTQHYTGQQLAQEIESLGMSISIEPGLVSMSMLSQDIERGLQLIQEILIRPLFSEDALEKVRLQLLADLDEFWDRPSLFITQLAYQHIYVDHPFAKNKLGTAQSLAQISKKDIVDYYKKFVTPKNSILSIVGDIGSYDIDDLVDKAFINWQGQDVFDFVFPSLKKISSKTIDYTIARDQVVLCYAGNSVSRIDSDYDKLLIFDQLFGGGITGSMSSRLFELRERTGLFYTIGGSLVFGATKQPGMVFFKTIVSLDDLPKAEKEIEAVIENGTNGITQQEFFDAQNILINSLVNNFESNENTARAFIFLERYNFSLDFFDKRAEQLLRININEVIKATKKVLQKDFLIKFRVGRF